MNTINYWESQLLFPGLLMLGFVGSGRPSSLVSEPEKPKLISVSE